MRYKMVGNTGIKVSELTLGTWGIGGAGWDANSKETRLEAIRQAYEDGITFFDTAPAYNGGVAESLLGEALHRMNARHEVIISTKCGNEFIDGQYVQSGKAEKILRECDESLKRLGTDYIDFYILHWPQKDAAPEETLGAMATLKEQGKVRFLGVSNHNLEQIKKAMTIAPIDLIQVQFSMLEASHVDDMKWATEHGLGVQAYGALGGGMLSGRYRELKSYPKMDSRNRFYQFFKEPLWSKAQALLKRLDVIASKRNVPLSELAINWTTQQEFVTTALVGTQHKERVDENCKAFDWSLSAAELEEIDRAIKETL